MRPTRWLIPATVAATVAGAVVVTSAAAGSAPRVADRTPAQVLASVAGSTVTALSGTVATRADLGLPALPASVDGGDRTASSDGGSAADPQAVLTRMLTGRRTLRVWLDGPQRQRVQLLDTFAEIAYVHDGRDVWAFDTGTNSGRHLVLPDPAASGAAPGSWSSGVPGGGTASGDPTAATPEALARDLLSRVDPTTAVTLDPPQTVAGRAAYTLVVTPRTDATLVDHATIAVDAANGAPLRVQVYARGHADPVLESGFRDIDFGAPDAARFRFVPPAGADVQTTELTAADLAAAHHDAEKRAAAQKAGGAAGDAGADGDVRVIGAGWTAIVEARPAAALDNPLLQQLTTRVDGGRAVRTRLFSVLVTDDGRVLAGAVPVAALVAAAR